MFRTMLFFRIIGTLLLAAAALKASGLGLDSVGRMGLLALPEVQLAVILFEVALGLWLWSGINPVAAWCVAVITFMIFAATTFYLGLVGETSCGCFGRFSPSPWYAFGLDVFVLALLAVGRPDLRPLWESPRQTFVTPFLPAALGFGGLLLFCVCWWRLPRSVSARSLRHSLIFGGSVSRSNREWWTSAKALRAKNARFPLTSRTGPTSRFA